MWYVISVFLVLIAVLLFRAIKFKPQAVTVETAAPVAFDQQLVVEHLSKMIQIPTISNQDFTKCDQQQFIHFEQLLAEQYPLVHQTCTKTKIDNTGLLFYWKGRSHAKPTVLMAHYDVVPVGDLSKWEHEPFSGQIIDNILWGRGTLDTKITLLGVMEGAETMIKQGFVPENDIYLSFAGDEEVAGTGAPAIVAYLAEHHIKPALVVDEGGAIVKDIFPTVTKDIAVIGIGEKGMVDMLFTANSKGGHASTPPQHTALGELAQAINACENKPFKSSFSAPILGLLDCVGRYASFPFRLVLANLWLFKGLLLSVFTKMGGELGAMIHTTQAFTMAEASQQSNVLPAQAKAVANYRLVNTDSVESVIAHLKTAINNHNIEVSVLHGMNASPYTDTKTPEYQRVATAVRQTWKDVIVSPYLMIACSDSRHFCQISDNVCRFSAMRLSKEQRGLIHNYNERIELPMIKECVEFYLNLIQAS